MEDKIIIPGTLIQIIHNPLLRNPRFWQYEELAIEYNRKYGIILDIITDKSWIKIYKILIQKQEINMGKSWITII